MVLFLRVDLLINRIQKMALHVWLPRTCLSHRSFIFAFAALCLTGLVLVAIFGVILERQRSSLVEYVIVGTDSHKSVLRLNRSQISIRRIEFFSKTCEDCETPPPVDSGVRPIVGVFLVLEATEGSAGIRNEDPFEIQRSINKDDGANSLLEIQESVHKESNDVRGQLEIEESLKKDDGIKSLHEIQRSVHEGPPEIHEPVDEDGAVGGTFSAADERPSNERDEMTETFIDCQPSFDYAIYVVLRSNGSESKVNGVKQQVTTPWIDRLLRRTTRECRSQRVNITVWLTTISSELNLVNALNDVLIEAYFDNVTWYDLLIWPDHAQRSYVPLRWAEHPTEVMARTRNVGVVTSGAKRLFVHRRHYEIFGRFFPLADWTLDTAVRYLLRLYSPQWSSHQRNGHDDRTANEEGIGRSDSRIGRKSDVVIGSRDGHDATVNGNRSDGVSNKKGETDGLAEIIAIDSHLLKRYVNALDASDFDVRGQSARVIAMSLYGDDPKYTIGAVRNAQLTPVNFPGWRLRIYCRRQEVQAETEGGPASCVSVPLQVTRKLEELGAELSYIDPGGLAPMLWRFLPVDDVTVDVFISRDSDSRLTERDAAIVSAWLETDTLFHCIRDHPSHAEFSVSGGLWGARTKWLRLLLGHRSIASLVQYGDSYLEDMRFLGSELWPLVQSLAYCHDSVSCDRWPNSHPIAIKRQRSEHVGQVFDAHSIPRQIDIDLLTAAERNYKCEPNTFS